jgi:hypothetical protein
MVTLPESWLWSGLGFVLSPLLAAFVSGYLVSRWKGRQDYIEKRFDEICTAISDTANLASEYWAGDAKDEGMKLREAKIKGQLLRVAGLRVLLSPYGSQSASNEMAEAESRFIRQTTGGDFGVHNRVSEHDRVITCQCAAAELIIAVRRARLQDIRGVRTRR